MMKSKFTVVVCALAIALAAVIGIFITLIATGVVDSTPKKLVISSGTAEKVYDGKEITSADWKLDSGTLREGHRLKVTTMGNQTDVGSCDNEFTAVVLDENGADVSEDYELVLKPGKLVVRARMLVIKSASASKIYDGTPLFSEDFTVVDGTVADGQRLKVVCDGTQTDVGECVNSCVATVFDEDNREVTFNYTFSIECGTISVTQKEITLQSGSDSKIYDGLPLTYENVNITAGSLVDGHTVNFEYTGTQTEVGSTENRYVATVSDEYGRNVTANYAITYGFGKLEVAKRTITLQGASGVRQYNGEPLVANDLPMVVQGELVGGQEIFAEYPMSLSDAGTINNDFVVAIRTADGKDVTANYEIISYFGTLTVSAAPLTIVSNGNNKTYDGTPLTDEGYRVVGELANPLHSVTVNVYGSQTEVGVGKNEMSVTVYNEFGTDVTSNYELTLVEGELLVTARNVTVQTADGLKTYDGTYLTNETIVSQENLLDGHRLDVTFDGKQLGVGKSKNTISAWRVYDWYGNDVSSNYNINVICGELVVNECSFAIGSGSASKVYDGNPLTCYNLPTVTGESVVWNTANNGEFYGTIGSTGHTIWLSVTASVTDYTKTSVENKFTYKITDQSGTDVTANYKIATHFGALSVEKRQLWLASGSGSKIYDGTPLTNTKYTIDNTSPLIAWHKLSVTISTWITEYGSKSNDDVEYRIEDEYGNDVSFNYNVNWVFGTLSVYKRELTIRSFDDSKEYDGEPLTKDGYEVVSIYDVVGNHTLEVVVSGTITEVGQTDNSIAQVIVYDAEGKDVSYNYEITKQPGILTVKSKGGKGFGLSMDGMMGGGGGQPSGTPLVDVTSEVSEKIYLKLGSFGDYNGKGWDRATAYDKLLDGKFGFDYLTGISLSNNGETEAKITIDNHMNTYVLATYLSMLDGDYAVQTSDEEYIGDTSAPYTAYYFYQRYIADYYSSFTSNLGKYAADELEYRNYVYANYMQVPDSTRTYLDEVIAHNGWKKGDANLLQKVASYIQLSAKYNLEYDTAMDEEDDLVLAFLTKYKEGVCRHYASAATLMFRALGYPARYTVGLTGKTVANKTVTITDEGAHAWTEVYLDGIGWVQLEVTGSGSSSGGQKPSPTPPTQLTVVPTITRKQYDGTPLTPDQEVNGLEDLIAKGYTYTATVTGSRTEVGYGISKITSFTLYDADGNDVTEDYEIRCRPGKLQVYISQLVFETGSASKTYDGTPIVATDCNLTFGTLANGHRIAYALAKGSQTKVGTSDNTFVVSIVDADGNDVSEYYYIVGKYGKLTVNSREVTFTAGSATKSYDGTALTCDSYEITAGSLAEGHTAVVTLSGSQTNKGRSDNVITSIVIYDADGNDVTANYITKRVTGTLQVTK